ncbi:MAG: hypothetical protein GW886_13195 [Rhodobacterales bacterium]|nr:hypothetical protein [Rhodobacterales bacterium]
MITRKNRNLPFATLAAAGALALLAGVASAQDTDLSGDGGIGEVVIDECLDCVLDPVPGEDGGGDDVGVDGWVDEWTDVGTPDDDETVMVYIDDIVEDVDGEPVAIADGEGGEPLYDAGGGDLDCGGCEVQATSGGGGPVILPRTRSGAGENASVHRSVHRGANICTTADLYVAWLCDWQGYAAPVN